MSVLTGVGFDPTRDTAHKSARAYPEVAQWLGRRELEGKAARTLDGDERYTAALLRDNLDLALGEYTSQAIEAFLVGVPPASRRKYRAHINELFKWAEDQDIIERSPMRRVAKFERPKQKIVETFSDVEIEMLCGLPEPDGVLYLILFDAGLRSAEVRALQVKHVKFEAEALTGRVISRIVIPRGKGGKGRIVPATDRLTHRLNDLFLLNGLERDDYLWYMRRGGHELNRDRELGPTSIKTWHTRCLKAAGIRYRKLHATRHTALTRMLRKGMSLTAVSRIAGHASVKTTADIYGHLSVDDLAAELELLEV